MAEELVSESYKIFFLKKKKIWAQTEMCLWKVLKSVKEVSGIWKINECRAWLIYLIKVINMKDAKDRAMSGSTSSMLSNDYVDAFSSINERPVDDISLEFFYKPHTITLLAVSIASVIYSAFVRYVILLYNYLLYFFK